MKSIASYGEITDKIVHFNMSTQAAMIDMFLRPQERAECTNDEFRTRPFTVGEYRSWYATTQGAVYDYDHCVLGVNFPSHVLKPFFDGDFDPLTEGEKELLGCLRGKKGPYYVIGTYGKIDNTLEHEICHGLFYTDARYKASILKAIEEKVPPAVKKVALRVLAEGYHKDVLLDEMHAYLATGHREFFGDSVKFPAATVNHFVRLKQRAFEKHGIDMDNLAAGKY
jgi:hypothetical protein